MEITVFGRTIRIFTEEQFHKLKELLFVTIGGNSWYRFAIICFCIFLLICLVSRHRRKKGKATEKLMQAGVLLYVMFLVSALVFSRPAGGRRIISWNRDFFMTGHVFHETTLVMVLIKLCMVIPFGAVLKKAFYKAPPAFPAAAAVLTGIIIEGMKYILGRGEAAIGSAILLASGTLIGICGESIILKLRNNRGKG